MAEHHYSKHEHEGESKLNVLCIERNERSGPRLRRISVAHNMEHQGRAVDSDQQRFRLDVVHARGPQLEEQPDLHQDDGEDVVLLVGLNLGFFDLRALEDLPEAGDLGEEDEPHQVPESSLDLCALQVEQVLVFLVLQLERHQEARPLHQAEGRVLGLILYDLAIVSVEIICESEYIHRILIHIILRIRTAFTIRGVVLAPCILLGVVEQLPVAIQVSVAVANAAVFELVH
mmetsp:Transcript_1513/g.2051  ORF Transcript_1513/g.2051 Transcript_1513/m.2051 type:complete len:231 (+) Transcript_1513:638-1330(+)